MSDTAKTDKHTALLDAIRAHALKQSKDGHIIIRDEDSGARDEWMFDFRSLMLQSKWLDLYAEIFWEEFGSRSPFQVGGMESAAIPFIAAIVMKGREKGRDVNGFFIRKSRKRQGLMRQIEGTLTDERIILVDDLVNSGGTFEKQVAILERLGKRVSDISVILAFRPYDSYTSLIEKGVTLSSFFTLDDFDLVLPRKEAPAQESFKEVWHFAAPSPSYHIVVQKSAPLVDTERVYFGCDDGYFRALRISDGALAWQWKIGRHPQGKAILSSPALHDGQVIFGAYDGAVYSLNAQTGTLRWKYEDADWIGSSPAIAADLGLVFIGLEFGLFRKRGGIAALELLTGEEAWSVRTAEFTHGSPLYIREEGLVVIGSNDGLVYGYDAKNGTERWRFVGGAVKSSFAYDQKRRLILFGSLNGMLYALKAKDGTALFTRETIPGFYSTPLVDGGTLYAASLDKRLYAIDLDTWKDRWIFETQGRIFSSPVIADSSIWIGSNDGRLYEISREGSTKGYFQTTERIVNRIAFDLSSKRFFVPTSANEIYCIERKS